MRTISVVAHKGGQLKTTTVVSLAACMAGQGRSVLVIDGDTQASATQLLLRGQSPRSPTLGDVLLLDSPAAAAIVPSGIEGVDLIPSEYSLADVNAALHGEPGRERRLREAMADLGPSHDICLIDTGPTRSLLTTNVMNFVTEILVPVSPGLFGILGFDQLRADVAAVHRYLENKTLAISGIVLVLTERNNVSKEFEQGIRGLYGDLVFRATVPRSIKFEEAHLRRQTIFEHARLSPGALAYEALTLEVLNRGRREEDRSAGGHLSAHDAA
jgi:chromosome partitioning protein